MVPDGEAAKVSLLNTSYLAVRGCGGALLGREMRVAILSAQLRLSQTHHNQHILLAIFKSSPQPASVNCQHEADIICAFALNLGKCCARQ
jgi:hypothetical protein